MVLCAPVHIILFVVVFDQQTIAQTIYTHTPAHIYTHKYTYVHIYVAMHEPPQYIMEYMCVAIIMSLHIMSVCVTVAKYVASYLYVWKKC